MSFRIDKVGLVLLLVSLYSFPSIAKDCKLRYGWSEGRPVHFIDKDGILKGIQIDFVKDVAEQLDCDIEFVQGRWGELLEKIREGQIDFISSATETELRKQYAHFSIPYHTDSFVVFIRASEFHRYKVQEFKQLKELNFKLGGSEGFEYGAEVDEWKRNKTFNHLLSYGASTNQNTIRLLNGELDGVLEDPFVISYKIKSKDIRSQLKSLPIKVIGLRSSFMFSKQTIDKEFIDKFNRAMKSTAHNGKFRKFWFDLLY